MASIFNTRKLDKDFGQGAAATLLYIDRYGGENVQIHDTSMKMASVGIIGLDSRGNGWPSEWFINYRYLLDNGYFSAHGEALAAAGEQMQREYFAAVKAGSLDEYYAKWGNAAGREYIIVP